MKKIATIYLAIALIMLTASSCTDEKGARKALEANNYKVIDVGGYDLFGGEDTFKTKFKAISPNKDTVTGTVTRGWFKGSTIRLD